MIKPNKEDNPKKTIDDENRRDNMQEKIENIIKQFYKYGLSLLSEEESKEETLINQLKERLENQKSIIFFSIGKEASKQVGIKRMSREYKNHATLSKLGDEAYKIGDYDQCIERYRSIFDTQKEIQIGTVAKLGMCYREKYNQIMLNEDLIAAINYLTITVQLSKERKSSFDMEQFNMILKTLLSEKERKLSLNIKQSEESVLQIKYFERNIDFCLYKEEIGKRLQRGGTLEQACEAFGLNREFCNILSLLYAKEYYEKNDFENGDKFLKKVEDTTDKSYLQIILFCEVKKIRRELLSKTSQGEKKMVLKNDNISHFNQ